MASLENYGSKCPRCGENTLSELDYYKSGISASSCRRCGFSSLTRTVGKWELSIIGKTMLDGKYQHILIGKKNGQTYWFSRGSRKEMAALLQTIDPETHLHAPYSC